MRLLITAVVLTGWAASLSGHTPSQLPDKTPDPTAAISGVVVDGTTGDVIEDAIVTIQGVATNRMSQTREFTDAKGRFVFVNLPPGLDYTLNANVPGYFPGALNRDAGPSDQRTAIPLEAGQWVRDVRLTVWKPGSISGRVLDETGEPMAGVYVRVLSHAMIAGRDQLVPGPIAITDDRGAFRVGGLDRGRYLIEVPSVQALPSTPPSVGAPSSYSGVNGRYPWPPPPGPDGRPRGYPMTFYPAARSASEATTVDVQLTEERRGIDISMEPVSLFKVSGTIQGPLESLTLRLMPGGLESLGIGSEAAAAPIAPDGSFSFVGVPAGAYAIDVRRRVPEFRNFISTSSRRLPLSVSSTSFSMFVSNLQAAPPGIGLSETQYGSNQNASNGHARVPVTVGTTDIDGVIVVLKASGVMDGTIELDAAPSAADAKPSSFGLSLDPASGEPELGAPSAQVQQTSFHFDSLRNGAYFLRASPSSGWTIKSIVWNGEDHTKLPFDAAATQAFSGVKVTLTNRVATIAGAVKEIGAAVVLFPADQAQWSNYGFSPPLIRTVTTSADGTFRFENLPAGSFFVVAVPAADRLAWLEPGFFSRMMPLSTRVSLDWGGRETANLSVTGVRR